MTQLDATSPPAHDDAVPALATAASHEAGLNRQANLQALSLTQPLVAHPRVLPRDHEWLFARDGFLSPKINGEWWSGCSVPLQTARTLLRGLQVNGTACYLRPAHAAELVITLQTLPPNQAVVAVVPDAQWFHLALHCHDFSQDLRRNRLWFATGPSWADEFRKIFDDHPALPIPTQVIRTPLLEPQETERLIPTVQRVLAEAGVWRGEFLKTLQERPRRCASSSVKRLCVVAPSRFRLWDGAGGVLTEVLRRPRESTDPVDCRTLDPDDPCSSGPLAFPLSARFCDALVVADRGREELVPFVPPMVSIVSWMTTRAIPRFDPAAARDALMLADPQWLPLARSAGWPDHRLAVAQWPVQQWDGAGAVPKSLSLIADTPDVSVPPAGLDLSSHRLLWELIHGELLDDPFAIKGSAEAYLTDRMARLGVQEQNFDRRRFVESLITPAYQQGLARLLLRERIPLRLHGGGWQEMREFSPHAAGPVRSRDELVAAARDAVVVDAWPVPLSHPVESLGRPVLGRASSERSYTAIARRLLTGAAPPPTPRQPLTAETILSLV